MCLLIAFNLVLGIVDILMGEYIASVKTGVFLTPPQAFDRVGLVYIRQRQFLQLNVYE